MNNIKTQESNTESDFINAPEIVEYKVGSTTYIITGKYKKSGKEGLLDKLWRLIENDEN